MKQCIQLIKRYDTDSDNCLSFKEFLNAILPLDNPEAREQAAIRDNYAIPNGEILPHEVEYTLAQIIYKEITLCSNVEKQMVKLLNFKDYNVQAAFKLIDKRHTRYITSEELKDYLKSEKAGATGGDIEAFIRRLDKDLDYRVSYKEFSDFFGVGDSKEKVKPGYVTTTKAFQSGTLRTSSIGKRPSIKEDKNSSKNSIQRSKLFKGSPVTKSALISKSSNSKASPKKPSLHSARTLTSTKKTYSKQHTIYTFLARQLEVEKELEALRKNLSLCKDLTVEKLWKLITPNGKQTIILDDLIKALKKLKIANDEEAVFLLFSRFDGDMDGKWTQEDVKRILFPMEEDYKEIILNKITKDPDNKIKKNTLKSLKELLKTCMQEELNNEQAKRLIGDINEREVFNEFDKTNKDFFTAEDVKETLSKEEIEVSKKDAELLLNRYDKDKDGKVIFSDFIREIKCV